MKLKQLKFQTETYKPQPISTPYRKTNSKWNSELNAGAQTTKLLEENTRNTL